MTPIDKEHFRTLEILAGANTRDFTLFKDRPEIKPYWQALSNRGLISVETLCEMSLTVQRFYIEPDGHKLLNEERRRRDGARFPARLKRGSWSILCFLLGSLTTASIGSFFNWWFNCK